MKGRRNARRIFERLGVASLLFLFTMQAGFADSVTDHRAVSEGRSRALFSGQHSPAQDSNERESDRSMQPVIDPSNGNSDLIQKVGVFANMLLALGEGVLAGSLLLVIARRRNETRAGLIALCAAVLAAIPFGVMSSLLAGSGLAVYLHGRPSGIFLEDAWPSPWRTFLVMLGLLGMFYGFQLLAIIPAVAVAIAAIHLDGSADVAAMQSATRGLDVDSGRNLGAVIIASWLTFLCLIVICGKDARPARRLGLAPPNMRAALVWTPLFLLVGIGMSWFSAGLTDKQTHDALNWTRFASNSPVIYVLAIGVFAPAIEELIFRGYLYSGWISRMGWRFTALGTSLLFMIWHWQYGAAGLLSVFLFAMLASALRRLTGSVIPCIVMHSLFNGWGLFQLLAR
jgi:membrane protease YdiL (CAAX protease family)